MNQDLKQHLRYNALRGVELVDGVTRLCAMNMLLHGIGPEDGDREPPIRTDDALRNEPSQRFYIVITNPPFGKTKWPPARAMPTTCFSSTSRPSARSKPNRPALP